ncbi:hypothetical protein [Ruegeria faecimaris]|uniref:hypothetical protein n=1 Tax=Ruegeria faecimaris TaxID=686389 RepID=UPI00249069A7|nr:hypothetical protein [Ruegeria faecimaris]
MSFRNSASFGKRIEYWVIGLLLKDGFDVFVPLVDDDGIDAIIRGRAGQKIDLQIKARSGQVKFGSSALFGVGQSHPKERDGYYFLFYSERLDEMWLMSSADFIKNCVTTSSGKNAGHRSIWMNGRSKVRNQEYPNPRFDTWRISMQGQPDFSRLRQALGE